MATKKINGILVHLESIKPYRVSIEASKQVITYEGATIEALFSELSTLQVDFQTLEKIKKAVLYLVKNTNL